KCLTSWIWLPSTMAKLSFSNQVTMRFQSSVTVTFTSTRSTSTENGLVRLWVSSGTPSLPSFVAFAGVAFGGVAFAGLEFDGGLSGLPVVFAGSDLRGSIWTFTSCATAKTAVAKNSMKTYTGRNIGIQRDLCRSGERNEP